MEVKLLDLRLQYESIKDEIKGAVMEVFESQNFILGPRVEELESRIAEYCGSRYAVGVSSGTDALLISLMAAGVGPGDLVVTTPYTFFATVGAITRVGGIPVFVDIDPETYNMDPDRLVEAIESIDKRERHRLKAVIPVHLYGQCADMEKILGMADEYKLVVIEDAAQAIGSEYEFGNSKTKRAGSMGQYGCFSFFPSKNLGAFGDGGMVTTDEEVVYDRLKILRVHGSKPKYYHSVIGGNFRLDALQAAVLKVKLRYLDRWTEKRQENAMFYRELFRDMGCPAVSLPLEREKRHIYNQFVIRVEERRDELRKYLNERGIGCEIYYPVPLHIQECFGYLGHAPEDFPVALDASKSTLALPIYPELEREQISYVVEMINNFMDLSL